MSFDGIQLDCISGYCPVQAEGTIDGKEFYFRARGKHWSIGIGGDVICNPEWHYREAYGTGPFAAGWMSEEEAQTFIVKAAGLFRKSDQSPQGRDASGEENG